MADRVGTYAYVKSPYLFEHRQVQIQEPGPGWMIVGIKCCGVCGTDLHTADRTAENWQSFGHEMSGTVLEVGEGVDFRVGDRVALDSSVPCGECEYCRPTPYGKGRPDLCSQPLSYWNSTAMGYGEFILTPAQCAVKMPDSMSFNTASMAEPTGVAIDMLTTAEVGIGDSVLVMGPGPIGLTAAFLAKQSGARWVTVAGRSRASARMSAALKLGADQLIETDKCPLSEADFSGNRPNKILVTTPPETLTDAIEVAEKGAVICFIGMAFGVADEVRLEADKFHTSKLSLKGSFASPSVFLREAVRSLEVFPQIGSILAGPVFSLENIAEAFAEIRQDHGRTVLKPIMVNES